MHGAKLGVSKLGYMYPQGHIFLLTVDDTFAIFSNETECN